MHKSPNVSSKIPTFALIATETLTLITINRDMEKKDLRIVFMGTPEFAVGSLQRLVEGGYNVVAVVTQPDKPVGRHGSVLRALARRVPVVSIYVPTSNVAPSLKVLLQHVPLPISA